jgi:SAM-dependent methyltransferase
VYLVTTARERSGTTANLTFVEGDGREIPFSAGEFEVVVFDTTLGHVPRSDLAFAEARRVLRAGGIVVVFDGDYATMTVAIGDIDPLPASNEATTAAVVYDPWFMRTVPSLLRAGNCDVLSSRGHGYMRTSESDYLISLVVRGADRLLWWNRIGSALSDALKAEARQRVEAGAFLGFIGYASLVARKLD